MIEHRELNQNPQGFELSILATLPNQHCEDITIESISEDFGCTRCHRVSGAIHRLIAAKFPVQVSNGKFGRAVWLHKHGSANELHRLAAQNHMKNLGY